MKKLTFSSLLFFILFNLKAQVDFKKIYWGDKRLDKQYGYFPLPPYAQDTSTIVAYYLPNTFPSKNLTMVACYRTEQDSCPTEIGLYLNEKMIGFSLEWYDDGTINNVRQKPLGVWMYFIKNEMVESGYDTDANAEYFWAGTHNFPGYINIELNINKKRYNFLINLSGSTIKQLIGEGNNSYYKTIFTSK